MGFSKMVRPTIKKLGICRALAATCAALAVVFPLVTGGAEAQLRSTALRGMVRDAAGAGLAGIGGARDTVDAIPGIVPALAVHA